ncbi:MAG: HTH domain-containing protein [Burkholderiaceae bacterium]
MLEILGARQKELLKLLLKNKEGMTADALSEQLSITRNAVRQHLAALENDGLLQKGSTRPTGGRPEQLYVLTKKGHECFPRHYSWFAQLLVESLLQEGGSEELGGRLDAMGAAVGAQLRAQHPELRTHEEKVGKLAEIMEEIGYSARTLAPQVGAEPAIDADNCVFHHLAMKNPDICRFDLALLASFTDSEVDHQECMARHDHVCRFRFLARAK